MPMNLLKQTSRTLIIEEFDKRAETPRLSDILRRMGEDDSWDEIFKEIEEKLYVRSFEEFVKRFTPVVWESFVAPENGRIQDVQFRYSLTKYSDSDKAIELPKNEFYQMVMHLYDQKGVVGKTNLEFDYSHVAEMLSPQRVLKSAQRIRADLNDAARKRLAATNSFDRRRLDKKINGYLMEAASQYRGSLSGQFKLALADVEAKIEAKSFSGNKQESPSGSQQLLPCRISFDADGALNVETLPAAAEQDSPDDNALVAKSQRMLAAAIGQDFMTAQPNGGEYMKNLVINNFAIAEYGNLDMELLERQREELTAIYRRSQQNFAQTLSASIEKMLDVKAFFDHATPKSGVLPENAGVIIANCMAEDLLEDDKQKEKFLEWLDLCQKEETNRKRIWFGILSSIGNKMFTDLDDDLDDDLNDVDGISDNEPVWSAFNRSEQADQISGRGVVRTKDGNSLIGMELATQMLEIMKDAQITTFFNFKGNERTGFLKFNGKLLEQYQRELEPVKGNAYAVFAYPNFTVLPRRETEIQVSSAGAKITIPGIYIDAAYVAAGLVAATQNIQFLNEKGYQTLPGYPCIRFDLEDGDNRFKVQTHMNCENAISWPTSLEEKIDAEKFGFCFCGSAQYYKGQPVTHTYVRQARSMAYSAADRCYRPVYTRLTMDFILRYIATDKGKRYAAGMLKISPQAVQEFIDNVIVEKWKSAADKNPSSVNYILRGEERVTLTGNTLHISFQKAEEEFDITAEEA